MRQEKRKKRGGEKAKSKSQDCCVTFKPKAKSEILLSAHALTSQADILHLDQKAVKCTTCKPVCGKFQLSIAGQCPENHSSTFKTRFSAKSPGANGLIQRVWLHLLCKAICFNYENLITHDNPSQHCSNYILRSHLQSCVNVLKITGLHTFTSKAKAVQNSRFALSFA